MGFFLAALADDAGLPYARVMHTRGPCGASEENEPMAARALKILLVDDDPDTLEILAEILAKGGHVVRTAADGRKALDIYASDFDVIVCDIIMPEMDGLQFIQQLMKLNPQARVIAYTGGSRYLGTEENLTVARMLGATRVITKEEIFGRLLQEVQAVATAPAAR